jgi:hypothetical protein
METAAAVPVVISDFNLSERSQTRENIQLHQLTNLFCECFERWDHGDVEKILMRELKHGQKFFVAMRDGSFVGFASWHPDGEATTGTGELRYIGWLRSVPANEVVPPLVEAIEAHAKQWFLNRFRYRTEKDPESGDEVKVEIEGFDPEHPRARLRKLFALVPAPRTGARTALEACGFTHQNTLPEHFGTRIDALYLDKYFTA